MLIQDRVRTGLEALTEEYTQRFAPTSAAENLLVETFAGFEWRVRQYMRAEAAIWEHSRYAFSARDARDLLRLQRLIESARNW